MRFSQSDLYWGNGRPFAARALFQSCSSASLIHPIVTGRLRLQAKSSYLLPLPLSRMTCMPAPHDSLESGKERDDEQHRSSA